jgi:hypothetical protein
MHTLSSNLDIRHAAGVLVAAVLGLALASPAANAEDFCALTANVVNSAGEPISSTWIELVNSEGQIVRREMRTGPTITICDFGFGPHTLRVGTNECLPTSISNLRVVIGRPLRLNVVINSCSYRDVVRNGCLLYVRVADAQGIPVPNADLSTSPPPALQPRTDAYGRYQGLIRGSQDITVTKPGFEPASTRVQCRADEELDIGLTMHVKK